MKKYLLLVLLSLNVFCVVAQNIVKAEYFIDADPGIGAATDVAFTSATSITDEAFSVSLTSLSDGLHFLNFRVKDANGVWSITERTPFYRLTLPTGSTPAVNIIKAEYFVDTDPGVGVATNIPITSGLSITDLPLTVNLSSLSDGLHQLYVRFKDANGVWSVTERTPFYRLTLPTVSTPAVNITKAEYFVDTDPGVGAATNIPITNGLSITDLPLTVNLSSLSDGLHQLYVRFKDANGVWSVTERTPFYRLTLPTGSTPAVNIVKAEYFVDTDPGAGAATNISITNGLSITDLLLPVNVSAIAEGTHKLFVRFKDANGVWSVTESTSFSVCNGTVPTASPASSITTSGFTASWATITGAQSYQLDVSDDNFNNFFSGYNSKTITAPTTSIGVTGLSQATTYKYRVRAVVTCASVASAPITVNIPVATPTGQPSNILFTSIGTTVATVSYTPPGSIPSGYLVVRRAGSAPTFVPVSNTTYSVGQTFSGDVVAYVGPNALFNETLLNPNTNYFYTIYSFNQLNGFYSYLTSTPLTGNVFTLATEPTAQPTNLQFTAVTSTSYTVSYNVASGPPAGYLVLRKVGSAPTSIPVDGTAYTTMVGTDAIVYQGSALSFTESGLTQNTNYYYSVFAYNGSGSSANFFTTAPLQGSKLTPITPPATAASNMVFSSVTENSISVSFSPPSPTPSGYVVVRKTGSGTTFTPQLNATYTLGSTLSDGSIVAYLGSSTSFSDNGLTASTLYYYDVFAYNQISSLISYQVVAPLESSKSTFTAEPTAQPTSVSFNTITPTSLKIAFVAASPAPSGYLVLRKSGSVPTSVPLDGTPYSIGNPIGDGTVVFVGNAVTANDLVLQPGTTYFYQIFSYNGSGVATNYFTSVTSSNSGSTITVPDKPVASAATLVQQNQFTANWSSTTGASSYRLDVSSDNFAHMLPGFDDLTVTSTSINVTGLDFGTPYQYRVRAVNASGVSVNSDAISQITIPPTPVFTAATLVGQNSFTANWNLVTGATGYYIDVSRVSDFSTFETGYQNILLGNVNTLIINVPTPGLTYYYRLRSTNLGGTSPNSLPGIQLMIPDNPIGVDDPNSTSKSFKAKWQAVTGATEYRVDVSLASNNFNPSLSNYTDSVVTGGLLELLVTGLIPNTAYKYRVRAINLSGKSLSSSAISVSTLDQGVGGPTSQAIPGLSSGGTLESYRMFSIPWSLQNNDYRIEDLFSGQGSQSDDKWKLLRWNSSGTTWDRYPGQLTTIDRGKSYWFNTTGQPSIVVTGTAYADASFSLTLQPGWNQIASPYDKNISWTDVLAINSSVPNVSMVETDLYKFVPSPASLAPTDNLKAWSGNFVFNKGSQIALVIPITAKEATGGRVSTNKEFENDISSNNWHVPFTLTVDGIESVNSSIGMHPEASIGIDQFDGMTVPRFIKYLEINSYHPEFFEPNFSRDIVPTSKNFNWHFMIESNSDAGDGVLSWDNEALGSNEAKLVLFDPTSGSIVDMKQQNQYRFKLKEKHPLQFFYASDEKNFKPDITSLSSVYPNPATSMATFLFIASVDGVVKIDLLDISGKNVKTIVNKNFEAGIHHVQWDVSDNTGVQLAAGLYMYRFIGPENTVQTGKLLIR